MQEKELPWDSKLEQSVLGSLLAYGTLALVEVIGDLDRAYFYDMEHQRIYDAIVKMFYDSEQIDYKTVAARCEMDMTSLLQEAVDLEALRGYVDALKRLYIKRFLIYTGNELAFLGATNDELSARDLLNKAVAMVLTSDILDADGGFVGVDVYAKEAKERIEALRNNPGMPGFATGLSDLDFLLGGLQGGDLIIIAGRPGSGKTALMIGIATYVAAHENNVGIFSYEMEGSKLVDRIAAYISVTDLQYLRTAQVPETKLEALYSAYEFVSGLPIWIDDGGKGNIGYILGKAKQLALQEKLDILCIDYLQLIPDHKKDTRNNILGEITQRLKNLAMELGIPIILLSQLNRAVEGREIKRPILADLRDSGNIEQDADIVMFVYRAPMYDSSAEEDEAELIIAKNRYGPVDNLQVTFQKEIAHFECWGDEDYGR
jgi:replicative DNA helicase